MTLTRSNPRAKPRWVLLAALVATVSLVLVSGALAVHDVGQLELDKDATEGVRTTPAGFLASNITNTATSINVCQVLTYDGVTYPAPANGSTILIEAEFMTVTANDSGSFGGNCPGTKQTYTVTRGVGSTATAHAGGAQKVEAGVSLITTHVTAALEVGIDWDQAYAAWNADNDTDCSAIDTDLDIVECTFIHDGIGPSIYTIGSTKDHLPIEGWFHTSGASPDKGEIINAYAAKALDGTDELLYFGMDRYAVDGSTDIGFWFFQDEVVACTETSTDPDDPCYNVPAGEFAGTHVEGDILILGTFTQGGATSNIRVFTWVDEGGNEQENIQGPDATFGDCVPGGAGDSGCATVNNASIKVPWTYTFKGSAKSGWVPAGGFFEGGVNLTALGLEGCFSSFLAETRSSPEITAILKDFALGGFESCDTELTTTPADGTGTALADSDDEDLLREISIGTGVATVSDLAALEVKGIAEWDGTLSFYLCGPGVLTCDDTAGTLISSHAVDETTSMPFKSTNATVSAAGTYCWASYFTSTTDGVPPAEDVSIGECFEVLPVPTSIVTQATMAAKIGDPIDDTATLSGAVTKPGDPIIDGPAGPAAGGTITFTAYSDSSCNTPVYTSVIGVSGNGSYTASDGDADGDEVPGEAVDDAFVPTSPGYYYWIASYTPASGDPNNIGSSGGCGDPNETSEVVDAYITISPLQDTNESGDTHVLTATVTQITGSGSSAAPDGTVVSFELSNNSAGADFIDDGVDSDGDLIEGNDCVTSGGTGACSVSITTTGTGDVDVDATTTFSVSGVSLTRSTDGTGSNSDNANKIFVDASIAISPLSDTNNINSQHVFTITVTLLPLGTVTDGPSIDYEISPAPDVESDTCATPVETGTDTDVYTCTVTINHESAQTFTLNAELTVTLDGLAITRDTDPGTLPVAGPGGSGPATKEFVDGSLAWIKHDQDGELLAGATFEVCQTHYLDTSGTPHVLVLLVDDSTPPEPAPECVSVVDDDGSDPAYAGLDEDADGGEFLLTGLELGTWTIRETAAPEGYAFDDAFTQTVEITLEDRTGNAATAFVNERLYKLIVITCNESTNQLVISEVTLDGVVKDTFGAVPASWGDVTEADICGLGEDDGAVYGGLDTGNYGPSVEIPKPPPPAG